MPDFHMGTAPRETIEFYLERTLTEASMIADVVNLRIGDSVGKSARGWKTLLEISGYAQSFMEHLK